MAVSVKVSGDVKKLTKHLDDTQRKIIPTVAVQAINEVAKKARQEGVKDVAREMRLPAKVIRRRFNRSNQVKGDRIEFFKASRARPVALLRVYHRGIPVFQIQTAGRKGVVKAKGGRKYLKAFRAQGLVFQRRGKERLPVFVPKVSVRAQLEGAFDRRINKRQGRQLFRRVFERRLRARLNRSAR